MDLKATLGHIKARDAYRCGVDEIHSKMIIDLYDLQDVVTDNYLDHYITLLDTDGRIYPIYHRSNH